MRVVRVVVENKGNRTIITSYSTDGFVQTKSIPLATKEEIIQYLNKFLGYTPQVVWKNRDKNP
ncbi:MAG: hypothetical protein J7K68_01410 [Candidatus Diapherotrites archaeon]|nr:hypothetical protein [Candidatus Diapherotrites archaeon]